MNSQHQSCHEINIESAEDRKFISGIAKRNEIKKACDSNIPVIQDSILLFSIPGLQKKDRKISTGNLIHVHAKEVIPGIAPQNLFKLHAIPEEPNDNFR